MYSMFLTLITYKGTDMNKELTTLEGLAELLHGLATVDEGVESVLSSIAFDGLVAVMHSLYGHVVGSKVESMFTQREDGGMVIHMENAAEEFGKLFKLVD